MKFEFDLIYKISVTRKMRYTMCFKALINQSPCER